MLKDVLPEVLNMKCFSYGAVNCPFLENRFRLPSIASLVACLNRLYGALQWNAYFRRTERRIFRIFTVWERI